LFGFGSFCIGCLDCFRIGFKSRCQRAEKFCHFVCAASKSIQNSEILRNDWLIRTVWVANVMVDLAPPFFENCSYLNFNLDRLFAWNRNYVMQASVALRVIVDRKATTSELFSKLVAVTAANVSLAIHDLKLFVNEVVKLRPLPLVKVNYSNPDEVFNHVGIGVRRQENLRIFRLTHFFFKAFYVF
jgi:hypothetical protein